MAVTGILSDYMSRKDLAAELGLREETLIRWERDHKGPPATRIGSAVKYHIPAVKAWLKAQEAAGRSASAFAHNAA